MATTSATLHSLSSSSSFSLTNHSSHFSASSFTFPIPKKTTQLSCFPSKNPIFINPIQFHGSSNVGIIASAHSQKSFNLSVSPVKKHGSVRDLLVAQATEAVAPTTEEAAPSQTKSSKKDKKKYPRKILDVYQILQAPIITEAAIKSIANENALLFTVDVRADKKMIRDAVKNFFGVNIRKVNTLIRPDGTKKAFIMLSKEYNASDIAKKIGIFPSSS